MDTLAVFRSRSEALKVYTLMRKRRLACFTVNTPAKLKLGCGMSIVFSSSLADTVKAIVEESGAVSFVGFYAK